MYFEHSPVAVAPRDKRMYLYAPTFRTWYRAVWFTDWMLLNDLLTDDEVIYVKQHMLEGDVQLNLSHIKAMPSGVPSGPFLMGCDALITDYSSILFDAYVLKKPVVLYEKDHEQYMADRGMYMNWPEDYSKYHCRDEYDLVRMLREARFEPVECMKSISKCDGHSTERVIELLRSLTEDER